jgi:hypothetical protein
MKKPASALVAAAVLLLAAVATAGPAWAHQEIAPTSFPTSRPAFLTLTVANERSADLTRVTLTAPAGGSFGPATRPPAGWTAERAPTEITWSGGTVAPGTFEQWGFEVNAVDQPGALSYSVNLGYADGASGDAAVEVTAVAAGAEPVPPTTPTPTIGAGSPPTTVAAPTPAAGATAEDTESDGLAGAALLVAIGAALLALVAIVMAARRRRPATAAGKDGADDTPGQDW